MRIYVAGLRAIFIPSSIYTFLYHLIFQINTYNFYNQKNILLLQEKNAGRGNIARKILEPLKRPANTILQMNGVKSREVLISLSSYN